MEIKKFKKVVDEYKDDITSLYIYYILVNDEELSKEIIDDELKMKFLILLINNAYLYGEKVYPLEFISEVAVSYIEEIMNNEVDAEELENLCSETYNNC